MENKRDQNRREDYRRRNSKEKRKPVDLSKYVLFFYLWASIFFLETLIRISTTGNLFTIALLFSFIFGKEETKSEGEG